MLEQMIADMLMKALPPEVMAMLSRENIDLIKQKVNAAYKYQTDMLEDIAANQKIILEILEGKNDGSNSSGQLPAPSDGGSSGGD